MVQFMFPWVTRYRSQFKTASHISQQPKVIHFIWGGIFWLHSKHTCEAINCTNALLHSSLH